MATLNIFEYAGDLGAESDMANGTFLNDVTSDTQLGVVVAVEEVTISQEAIDVIRNAQREGGSFACMMLTKHSPEASDEHSTSASIGMLGRGYHWIKSGEAVLGRTCDISVLDMMKVVPNNPPEEFMAAVEHDRIEQAGC